MGAGGRSEPARAHRFEACEVRQRSRPLETSRELGNLCQIFCDRLRLVQRPVCDLSVRMAPLGKIENANCGVLENITLALWPVTWRLLRPDLLTLLHYLNMTYRDRSHQLIGGRLQF